jgi:hypothetical protein
MGTLERKHWTNGLFVAYGLLCALVLGTLLGQLVFGSVSLLGFAGICLASAVSFLAGAGTKGSLLVGTTSQLIAGAGLGLLLIAGCLWLVHWLMIGVVIIGWTIPGEVWIAVSALIGFVGATRADAT